jgi:hypothetical protein
VQKYEDNDVYFPILSAQIALYRSTYQTSSPKWGGSAAEPSQLSPPATARRNP